MFWINFSLILFQKYIPCLGLLNRTKIEVTIKKGSLTIAVKKALS